MNHKINLFTLLKMFWNTHKKSLLNLKNYYGIKKISLATLFILSFTIGMLLSFYIGGLFSLSPSLVSSQESPEKQVSLQNSYNKKKVELYLTSREQNHSTHQNKNLNLTALRYIEKGNAVDSFKLTGTIIATNKKLAVFEDLRTRKQRILKEGEFLNNFRIMTIKRKSVMLRDSSSESQNNKTSDPSLAHLDDTSSTISTVIKKIGPHHYEIAKRVMLDNLKDPAKFLKQVRLVPSVDNGKSNGFILRNMKEKSFLREIGFEEGDIVKKINGTSLDDTFTAIKQFASLSELNSVFIELLRNNKNIVLKYTIR